METKEILLALRKQHQLTQDELAEKLFVTRQAVVPLGNRRDRSQYGNIETAVKSV